VLSRGILGISKGQSGQSRSDEETGQFHADYYVTAPTPKCKPCTPPEDRVI
jgi:hypothetical protein